MKKWSAKTKKIVISATAGIAAAAVLAGVFLGLRGRKEPVGVYPFPMVGMTEFWGDNQESYGPVTTDRIQTVFLSDTQTVKAVLVQQGDTVRKGDVLMSYDTSLSELQVERKRLDVEKAKLQLREAQEELARISKLEPMTEVEVSYPTVSRDYGRTILEISNSDNMVISADSYDGSSPTNPMVVWLSGDRPLDNGLLKNLYTTAVDLQMKNTGRSSSASAMPDTQTQPETTAPPETMAPTETTEPAQTTESTEATVPEETTQLPESGEFSDGADMDAYQAELESFVETAPQSMRIYSWSVADGGVFNVRKGNAANLYFTIDIEDPIHRQYVQWKVDPADGSLQGMPNGLGNFTLSGIPVKASEEYTITATYKADGVSPLTSTYRFTLSAQEEEQGTQWSNAFYMVLRVTAEDRQYAPKIVWQGIQVTAFEGGGFGFRLYDAPVADPLEQEPEQDAPAPDVDYGSGMTAAEIARMYREQEKKVQELAAAERMLESEYNLMVREFSDGYIRATLDGLVVSLLDEDEARQNKLPVLKISDSGGFYVQGSVSELEKDNLKVGQEVSINDWNTGSIYTGQVQSIGDFPTRNEGWNGMGNPNTSYYPFRVYIDGSANLQEGSYVSVTYSAAEAENGIYLENPFLRTENGESYVYVRGGNGKLEKRNVTTGKSLWGSYTEIRSGLTADDYVAFPYGKTVKTGAATKESDLSALYGY